jgi:hypothetical protein
MVAKIEIYTFNIVNRKNDEVKVNFDSNTLGELFDYLKMNLQNKINQFPPTKKERKTFKLASQTVNGKKETFFNYSSTNKRFDGILTVGSDADKILKFTSADKHKKDSGTKAKGLNIDRNYYFQILFIEGSDTGFLVLEKNQKSCKNDFCKVLETIINQKISDVKLKVNQYIEQQFYENYLRKGKYNSIKCVRKGVKNQNSDGIINLINQGNYKIETKLTADGDLTDRFKQNVLNALNDKKYFFEIPEFKNLNYSEENDSYLIINSEYNNKSRTIDLSNVAKVKPLYDLDDVEENPDGSSKFNSIRMKTNELLKELDINLY